jgi:PBP1b-binding outer membrane lipoprotein LpoB
MKKKLTTLGLVGITLLLTSCSPDDFQEENQQQKQVEIEFDETQLTVEEVLIEEQPVGYDDDNEGNPLNPKDKG